MLVIYLFIIYSIDIYYNVLGYVLNVYGLIVFRYNFSGVSRLEVGGVRWFWENRFYLIRFRLFKGIFVFM